MTRNKGILYLTYPFGNSFSVYSNHRLFSEELKKSGFFRLIGKVYDKRKIQAEIFLLDDSKIYIKNSKEFDQFLSGIKKKKFSVKKLWKKTK